MICDIILVMPRITKELKSFTFEYDEERKVFTISEADGMLGCIELNKVYAFAFMRFVIRMAQKNWLRSFKLTEEILNDNDNEETEDPSQLKLF